MHAHKASVTKCFRCTPAASLPAGATRGRHSTVKKADCLLSPELSWTARLESVYSTATELEWRELFSKHKWKGKAATRGSYPLLAGGSAWTAKNSDFEQYLMISLSSKKTVTSIVTMGKQYSPEFVQEFKIFYGDNGGDFTEYKDREGNTKLFQGNSDGDSQVHNVFETPIIAQYIRINPTRWRDRISLRVELYGCEYEAESLQLDGQSFVVMALGRRPVTSAEDAVRLRFRTNHADGLLLYSRGSQRDLLALQLVHNRLLLSVDLGGEGLLTEVWCGSLLDDNVWHDVQVSRFRRQLVFTVDRVVVRQRLRGDSFQLDLNREASLSLSAGMNHRGGPRAALVGASSLAFFVAAAVKAFSACVQLYIGGMANFNQDGVKVAANFSGCLENVMLNDTNVIGELKRDYESWTYSKVGQVLYSCRYEQVIPVTFVKSESMLRIGGYMQRSMNCSFDFRTFNEQGLLLYNKFTGEGYVKLFLDMGRIRVELQGKGTPVVLLKPFDEAALKSRAKSSKHDGNVTAAANSTMKNFLVPSQSEQSVYPTSSQSTDLDSVCKKHELMTDAEILWALKVTTLHYSYNSCSQINDFLRKMFPHSKIV
ncbi:hypothetical protein HPB48_012772 [Haemaphysalis longicornis]|uniref:Neurexin IV n=1 Tax=Haemaphysalis longicornis TaxID=44386 RepID=A0A9J6G1F3_HAELO|nr:hypothetical protein HPB48_012772 [Haemaphysalis longicornis]